MPMEYGQGMIGIAKDTDMEKESVAGSTIEFLEQERLRMLDACTQCGRCYEVCPMTPGLSAQPGSSQEAVGGVLAILKEASGSTPNDAAALEWVDSCTRSGLCVPACPHSVNPKLMLRLARIKALGSL